MSLTKEVTADKIEVVTAGDTTVVQVRTATKVMEDGVQVGSTGYHRHIINSGDDYSSEPANVQAICTAVFS